MSSFDKSMTGQKGQMTCVVLICMLFFPADYLAQTQTSPTARENVADNEYQTGAILWTQSSGEYRALAYQAFSLARFRLDQVLQNQKKSRTAAVTLQNRWRLLSTLMKQSWTTAGIRLHSSCAESHTALRHGRPGAIAPKPVRYPERLIFSTMLHIEEFMFSTSPIVGNRKKQEQSEI